MRGSQRDPCDPNQIPVYDAAARCVRPADWEDFVRSLGAVPLPATFMLNFDLGDAPPPQWNEQGRRIPVVLEPQPEGGFTVTSPAVPELLTEGDTVEEALKNVQDALAAVREMYEDEGQP